MVLGLKSKKFLSKSLYRPCIFNFCILDCYERLSLEALKEVSQEKWVILIEAFVCFTSESNL